MPIQRVLLIATVALASLLGGRIAAEEPQDTYKTLFGDKEKAVRDPVTFAKELLDAGKAVADAKPLQGLLFRKACEWGSKDTRGLPLAVEALEALAAAQPQTKTECDEKLLGLYDRQYTGAKTTEDRKRVGLVYLAKLMEAADAKAGDDQIDAALAVCRKATAVASAVGPDQVASVLAKAKNITDHQRVSERRMQLEAKFVKAKQAVQEKPQNQIAQQELQVIGRQLAEFLVAELGDAKAATGPAEVSGDDTLKSQVLLAAKEARDLNADQAVGHADWLKSVAPGATDTGKHALLVRAKQCYERFLAVYDKKDATRLQAEMNLQALAKSIEGTATAASSRTLNLLAAADPKQDAVAGKWTREANGDLVSDATRQARLRFPYTPPTEYDLRVEFTRLKGDCEVALILARAGRPFVWQAGAVHNTIMQLLVTSQGKDAGVPAVKAASILTTGVRHVLVVNVRQESLTAQLDGKTVVRYATDGHDLANREDWSVGPNAIGIGTWESPTVFHVVEVVEITGKGQFTRPVGRPRG